MGIKISDVAKEAGVSPSTVSKVINNWSTISPATKEKVHDAINKLGYVPNQQAASFARGSTKNIIFLSSFEKESAYTNPHMYDILCGARNRLSNSGYNVTIDSIPENISADKYMTQLIGSRTCDGILIHGSGYSTKMAKPLLLNQFPHMIIGSLDRCSVSWIDTDNTLAGQFAASVIIKKDYSRVAYIGNRQGIISAQRLNGFLGGMYDYGYRIPDEYMGISEVDIDAAEKATLKILALKVLPEVIVCENNIIALGASRAIKSQGLHMPDDITLVTFDSFPYSKLIDPTPTVIDIDMYDLGSQAAEMLLRKIDNPALLIQTHTALPVIK